MFWRRSRPVEDEPIVELPGADWFWRSLRVRFIWDEVGREFDEVEFYWPRREA